MPQIPPAERPKNPEVQNENQGAGSPPRPATEPPGAQHSTRTPKTETDPATGESGS